MSTYIIITPFFPSDTNFRGPFVYDFAKAIINSGKFDKVLVFVPKALSDKRQEYTYQGINVRLFPIIQMPSYLLNGILNFVNKSLFLNALDRLKIDFDDITIAHSHTGPLGIFALALKEKNHRIKTLLHHHDPDPYTILNGLYAGNLANLWVRAKNSIKIFKNIDVHVCISNYVKRNLVSFPDFGDQEHFQPYRNRLKQAKILRLKAPFMKNIIVLHNGVDLSKFKRSDINRCTIDFKIGCIGNFIDWKNQLTLLKATDHLVNIQNIKNIKIQLIGSGPLINDCKEYVEKSGIDRNVEFLREVDHSVLPTLINTFDLFVLPSYFEGFGCVFAEAAACGVPFVCCIDQGISEYLNEDQILKWAISPMDHIQLAKIILRQMQIPQAQTYKYPFDINSLVSKFLTDIGV
ncbi:glycosyltransferase family 4 protein [Duncaniella muris]|uniref:glycosyltransferase family 4 protein n=1 Tax=Duncaniella muris TaxID=2094150 RepID=UPI002714BFCA|nr:glycosyltransferase family 4 protein [Duncaniella muris]